MTPRAELCPDCGRPITVAVTAWEKLVRLAESDYGEFVIVNGVAVDSSPTASQAGLTIYTTHRCVAVNSQEPRKIP